MTHKVLKAMTVFGGVQVVGVACALVRAKLIALWIGPVGVGLFGIFNSALEMMSSTTQLNIRQSAVRDISRAEKPRLPLLAASVRWWTRNLGITGALLMLMLSPLLSYLSFNSWDMWWTFAVLAIALMALGITAGEQTLMQGTGRLRSLASSTMWGMIGGTAVSVPFYYFLGVNSVLPSIVAFAFVGAIASLVYCDVKSGTHTTKDKFKEGQKFLQLGFYLTVTTLVTTGASYIFLSYLNNRADTVMVGLYQSGNALSLKYVGMVFTALAMEYYPRLSQVSHNAKSSSRVVSHQMAIILCVLLPIVILFIAFDDILVQLLYNRDFLPAVPMITIGICGALFRGMSYCTSYVMVARGDGKAYVICEIASALVGLALSIIGFEKWGLFGIGCSYVAWYAIYTAMSWGIYRWRYGMRLSRKVLMIALMAIAVAAVAYWLRSFAWYAPLAMLIPAALLAYGAKRK